MAAALHSAAAAFASSNHSRNCLSDTTFTANVKLQRRSLNLVYGSLTKKQVQGCRARLEASGADVGVSTSSPDTDEQLPQGPPMVELQFLSPVGDEVRSASAVSGEKLLRTIMIDNKIELYDLWGKVMNCGGVGSCGTCIVQVMLSSLTSLAWSHGIEILEGQELLNERTDAEYKYLKKKPDNWRLSCQTIVGDKSNSGKVVVQQLPQKK